jgi:NAD(P)-dependent dehydrogenase (short-subunit alcohol dehydrogenase family)
VPRDHDDDDGTNEVDDEVVAMGDPTVLVNAAGCVKRGGLARTAVEEVQEMVDVNLMATVWACKFMLPGLLRQKQALGREAVLDKKEVNGELDTSRIRSPCIVNVSSLLASHGGAGASVYAASKAAVVCKLNSILASEWTTKINVAFSRALAEEYGRLGIRVNTLLPGFIDTDMIYDGVGKTAIPFVYITYRPNNMMKAGEFYIQ